MRLRTLSAMLLLLLSIASASWFTPTVRASGMTTAKRTCALGGCFLAGGGDGDLGIGRHEGRQQEQGGADPCAQCPHAAHDGVPSRLTAVAAPAGLDSSPGRALRLGPGRNVAAAHTRTAGTALSIEGPYADQCFLLRARGTHEYEAASFRSLAAGSGPRWWARARRRWLSPTAAADIPAAGADTSAAVAIPVAATPRARAKRAVLGDTLEYQCRLWRLFGRMVMPAAAAATSGTQHDHSPGYHYGTPLIPPSLWRRLSSC